MRNLSIFLMFVFVGLGLSSQAQIQRGNVMVGANFADMSLDLDGSGIFSANITPKAAWFIQDNMALGGYVNFGIVTGSGSTITNYGVGALGRYYSGADVEILRHGRLLGKLQ